MLEIKYRKLKELHKLHNNPRTIDDDDFKALCKSIKINKEYFEARALILSDRTGQLVVIAGNQRYDAAEYLGLKEVPTILIPNLTEDQEKEIIIRDNVSNGQWDFDELTLNWNAGDLKDWGVDLPDEYLGEKQPTQEIKEVELKPYKKTHVLLSFAPEKMIELQDLLTRIKAIEGIEYEQASN